jgi:hypothetical protein
MRSPDDIEQRQYIDLPLSGLPRLQVLANDHYLPPFHFALRLPTSTLESESESAILSYLDC